MRNNILKIVFAATLLSITVASSAFADTTYYNSGTENRGWVANGDTWNYIDNSGSLVTDTWKESNGSWFYLNSEGNLAIDEVVEYSSKYYYVDEHGAMIKDSWVAVPEDDSDLDVNYRWMYFGSTGAAYTSNDSKVSLKTINGKKYAFDSEGKMLFGFVDEGGTIRNNETEPVIGSMYYFGTNDDGALHTGWLKYTDAIEAYDDKDVIWFYYNTSSGKMTKDATKTINGRKYKFDSDGVMTSEWVTDSATTSSASKYYSDDNNGAMAKKEWVRAIPSEDINSEDHENDEYRWFYVLSSGDTVIGKTKKINSKWYVFDNDGIMKTEFVELDSKRVSDAKYVNRFKAEDISAENIYSKFDDNVNGLFYFSDSEDDGSMKTGTNIKIELSDDSYTFAYKKNTGTAYNGIENNKLYRCGILQTGGDDKYKVKKYFDGTDYKYYVVNTSGTILKAGSTGKTSNDTYYGVYNSIGDVGNIKCFSGDDASKIAHYYAKNGNTDVSYSDWTEVSFDY